METRLRILAYLHEQLNNLSRGGWFDDGIFESDEEDEELDEPSNPTQHATKKTSKLMHMKREFLRIIEFPANAQERAILELYLCQTSAYTRDYVQLAIGDKPEQFDWQVLSAVLPFSTLADHNILRHASRAEWNLITYRIILANDYSVLLPAQALMHDLNWALVDRALLHLQNSGGSRRYINELLAMAPPPLMRRVFSEQDTNEWDQMVLLRLTDGPKRIYMACNYVIDDKFRLYFPIDKGNPHLFIGYCNEIVDGYIVLPKSFETTSFVTLSHVPHKDDEGFDAASPVMQALSIMTQTGKWYHTHVFRLAPSMQNKMVAHLTCDCSVGNEEVKATPHQVDLLALFKC